MQLTTDGISDIVLTTLSHWTISVKAGGFECWEMRGDLSGFNFNFSLIDGLQDSEIEDVSDFMEILDGFNDNNGRFSVLSTFSRP